MEGLEITIKSIDEVLNDPSKRYDSEYYLKAYDIIFDKLKLHNLNKVNNLCSKVTQGPNPLFSENSEDIPCLTGRNINKGRVNYENADYVSLEEYTNLIRFQIKKGDTLITLKGKGSIGKIGFVTDNRKAIFSRNIGLIRPNKINEGYLNAYLLSNFGKTIISRGETGGTGQSTLTSSYLQNIDIPLLNIDKEIGEVVIHSEKELKKSQQKYIEAENLLLETTGLKYFQPSTEVANVKSIEESFLISGRLDAEYYQPKYEDLFKIITTQNHKSLGTLVNIKKSIEPGSSAYQEEGIPFVRVSNLSKFGISQPEIYLDKKEFQDIVKPKKDTILLSKDGSVGIAYKAEANLNCITSGAILHLEIKDKRVLPDYLTLVLNSLVVKLQAERDAGGSIIQHWKPSEIQEVIIPIIDDEIQQEISQLVKESFALKIKSEKLLEIAKHAVEIAIEENEEVALEFINKNSI
ncbi:restriction endonuclease subunit S [Elizabethkingia anophelis]|uniref:restriction endonuclease subunit S n=1 Tax=Elizabethkingia anophelis TaxID=1117645 RepID=UPI0016269776|nr:restriction endonuclease subunit S [Elizabethkingia anophelis]